MKRGLFWIQLFCCFSSSEPSRGLPSFLLSMHAMIQGLLLLLINPPCVYWDRAWLKLKGFDLMEWVVTQHSTYIVHYYSYPSSLVCMAFHVILRQVEARELPDTIISQMVIQPSGYHSHPTWISFVIHRPFWIPLITKHPSLRFRRE